MSKTLTATDRSNLIRLASSLEKGSKERRAILAGLKKTSHMKLDGGPPPNEKVTLTISGDRGGGTIAVVKTTMSRLQEYNDLLDDLYVAAGGDGGGPGYLFAKYEEAKETIADAQEELREAERELKPLMSRAKKLKVDVQAYIKQDMRNVGMDFVDSSGQKWYLDAGQTWEMVDWE
jgi:hypothetical protein